MNSCYKFRIYPNKTQIKKIEFCLGLCRNLYNTALEERKTAYQRQKISRNYYDQANCLPEIKQLFPEYKDIHSQILQDVLKRASKSFDNFFRRLKKKQKPGYPRFKNRERYRSFTYPQSGFKVVDHRVYLSGIGYIKLVDHREMKEGKIKTCSVIRTNTGKYYVCFSVELPNVKLIEKPQNIIGLDLGIKQYITTSDGEVFNYNVKNVDKQLAKLQRKKEAAKRGSEKRKELRLYIAKLHEKQTNRRIDFQHKLARKIVTKYDLIGLENLNIQSMLNSNKHGLNKLIEMMSWYRLVQLIVYKAVEAGKLTVLVDPMDSTQTCSCCNHKNKEKLTLKDRIFICEKCGMKMCRDKNAARNILNRAIRSCSEEIRTIISDLELGQEALTFR